MKSILFVLLCCLTLNCFAQEEKTTMMDFPEMSRAAGVSFQKFNGLNDRIATFPQYKTLRTATPVLQLGWFKERHQFISQINLMAGSSMSGERDKRSSTIRYLGVGGEIGYDFLKTQKLALFPLVGLGYQGYQARFFRDNSGVNFNNVANSTTVQQSLEPLQLKNGFFNYRLGAGFAATSEKMHASIGVQVMYTGSFQDREWRTNDNQVLANSPSDGLSQWYAGLVITCSPFAMMMHHRRDK